MLQTIIKMKIFRWNIVKDTDDGHEDDHVSSVELKILHFDR